ncbi:SCO6880 family protein [Rothia sp. ZJ932]|uniref:SCO6880 family protein n=1 Tax=Rothia sp. ZJ932 TaxID=2810516 RepID=UPI0019670DCB|nr:SCO6880 family protein [Rothia sp. ZJ932]QRZ61792.1 hypothetical protein JR346_01220 [Rothia sp. ZJ932]
MSTTADEHRPKFGNIIEPASAGFYGVPEEVSDYGVRRVVLLFVLWFILSFVPVPLIQHNAIWIIAALAAFYADQIRRKLKKGKDGRYDWEEKMLRKMFAKAKANRWTEYRPGPSSDLPDGSYRAPGLLAATQMQQYQESYGNDYAFLWDPGRKSGTVFFSVSAPGLQLLDQSFINSMVAQWAAYHRAAGIQSSILQVAAITESTMDTGTRLPQAVGQFRSYAGDHEVPTVAREVIDEVIDIENQQKPRVEHIVSMTFSAKAIPESGLPVRNAATLAEEISTVMHGFAEGLSAASSGTVSIMDAQSVIDYYFTAYNPAKDTAIDQARQEVDGTGLVWENIGPDYHNVHEDYYEHSHFFSKSFQMWRPPMSLFQENALQELLGADRKLTKKRVTIFFRPLPPDSSQKQALEAVNNARFFRGQKGNKGGSSAAAVTEKAQRTENEMGDGALLVPFSLIATVTTDNPDKFPNLSADLKRRGSTGIMIQLREATMSHDAAFSMGLGAGLVPIDFKMSAR